MLLSAAQVRTLEKQVFANGESPESLMEEAGSGIARILFESFPTPGHAYAVFGKGHNGGDALVVARELAVNGWKVTLVPATPPDDWSALTRKKFGEAGLCEHASVLPPLEDLPHSRCILLIDGLLGIGSAGPLSPEYAKITRQMNQLRHSRRVRTVALDIPSGLNPDSGNPSSSTVYADITITIGFPKPGLIADQAIDHVGRIELVPLRALTEQSTRSLTVPQSDTASLITSDEVASLIPRPPFSQHKGAAGRVLVVAGSNGMAGAAALCASGALRSGAGLVTLFVPEDVWPVTASMTPAPIMVRPLRSLTDALDVRADALVVGPGLGRRQSHELNALLHGYAGPLVLDADALNGLSVHAIRNVSENRETLLTPHPGELQRLLPQPPDFDRRSAALALVDQTHATVLLKGSRTIIAAPNGAVRFNTTGCPGMATAGMGDVLSGVAAAFLARKVSAFNAASAAAWLCGKTAQIITSSGHPSGLTDESLTASDIIQHLGLAFQSLP